MELHLSSKTDSGYLGVYRPPSGRYEARIKVDGHMKGLGAYDTAVDAAVAVAKYKSNLCCEECSDE